MSQAEPTPEDPQEGDAGAQERASFSFADKRRVDPTDGSVRPSGPAPQEEGQASTDPLDAEAAQLFAEAEREGSEQDSHTAELEQRVAELEEELKRSQAEYVNSRRRIEAAAKIQAEAAAERVIASLISVLDDVHLGRQHGDIAEGTPFHAIAVKLEDALRAHGLERFGEEGEEFDPSRHEALMHEDAEDVEVNTVKTVLQPGYLVRERVLRPARVATRGPQ